MCVFHLVEHKALRYRLKDVHVFQIRSVDIFTYELYLSVRSITGTIY